MAKDATVTLRLDAALKAELEAAARQAERSLSAEIVYRLKQGRTVATPTPAPAVVTPAADEQHAPAMPSYADRVAGLTEAELTAEIAANERTAKGRRTTSSDRYLARDQLKTLRAEHATRSKRKA